MPDTPATPNPLEGLNPTQQADYKEVASELRCLVCQNQSLADSHAHLAIDLKLKVAEQIQAGKSKAEIKHYMQDRYGEFILYKPAMTADNAVLWAGPFLVLALAAFVAFKVIRRNARLHHTNPPESSEDNATATPKPPPHD